MQVSEHQLRLLKQLGTIERAVEAATSLIEHEAAREFGGRAPWMDIARAELGVRELPGDANEAQVLAYLATCHRSAGGNLGDWAAGRDQTPWCSAFVNWCLLRAGIEGTRNAAARSWLVWGEECHPPRPGAIAVLTRDGGGHVAFVDSVDEVAGTVALHGGNQGNAVSVKPYPLSRVIGFRWPEGKTS